MTPHQTTFLNDLEQIVNVSQVSHYSPFRYPGGKTWFVPRMRQWLASLPRPALFIEPFCGGGIIGLTVAMERLADRVLLVERDPQVAAVWQLIIHGSRDDVSWLLQRIRTFEITPAHVAEVLAESPPDLRERAFRTLLRNRVNHGGCLAQGTGMLKTGERGKGLRSRWYPETIARRIEAILPVRECMRFVHGDGVAAIQQYGANLDGVFFIDPPYIRSGRRLYDYADIDHVALFQTVAHVRGDFLMTYDPAESIQQLAAEYEFATALIRMQNKRHDTQQELIIGRNLQWAIPLDLTE
jgi:DNA adenine methylase